MLSEVELSEIKNLPAYREMKKASGLEALKIIQRHRRWVSDEALEDLAVLLEVSCAELESVATFYNLIFRRPVGRHVILVCDSVTCWVVGYERVLDHLKRRLGIDFGETTADGRFTLLPHACLGACDRAPAIMIDDELYGPLDEQRIDTILEDMRD